MDSFRYVLFFLVVIAVIVSQVGCTVKPCLRDQKNNGQNGIYVVVGKMDEEKEEDFKLEDFDKLFVGDLVEAERNLRALLPQAKSLDDKSIYIQILSQIALAEAVQKKFDAAHATLDQAEEYLREEYHLARVRILLERGRVFYQQGNIEAARPLFIESFELSAAHGFDYHTVNAAHMVPFVAKSAEEKIEWNKRAIELAEKSSSVDAKQWLGSLYNNIGQAYLEAKQYPLALSAFNKALEYREQENYLPNIRVAKWAVARTLRLTGKTQEALSILLALLEEYQCMEKTNSFDVPIEMIRSSRGLVYEELAEIGGEKSKTYAALAYDDLSQDEWFARLEPERLERLKLLGDKK